MEVFLYFKVLLVVIQGKKINICTLTWNQKENCIKWLFYFIGPGQENTFDDMKNYVFS